MACRLGSADKDPSKQGRLDGAHGPRMTQGKSVVKHSETAVQQAGERRRDRHSEFE